MSKIPSFDYSKIILADHILSDSHHDGTKDIEKALYKKCDEYSEHSSENVFLKKIGINYIDGSFSYIEKENENNKYSIYNFNNIVEYVNLEIPDEFREEYIDCKNKLESIVQPINLINDFAHAKIINTFFKLFDFAEFNIVRNVFTECDPAPKPVIRSNIKKNQQLDASYSIGLRKLIGDGNQPLTSIAGVRDNIGEKNILYTVKASENLFNCEGNIGELGDIGNTMNLETPLQLSAINYDVNIGMLKDKGFLSITSLITKDTTIYDSKSSAKSGFNSYESLTNNDIIKIEKIIREAETAEEIPRKLFEINNKKKSNATNAVAKYLGDTYQALSAFIENQEDEGTNGIVTHDRLLVAKSIMSQVPFILYWNGLYNSVSIFINNDYVSDEIKNKMSFNTICKTIQKSIIQTTFISNIREILLQKEDDIFNIGLDKIKNLYEKNSSINEKNPAHFNSINIIYQDIVALSYSYYEIALYLKSIIQDTFSEEFIDKNMIENYNIKQIMEMYNYVEKISKKDFTYLYDNQLMINEYKLFDTDIIDDENISVICDNLNNKFISIIKPYIDNNDFNEDKIKKEFTIINNTDIYLKLDTLMTMITTENITYKISKIIPPILKKNMLLPLFFKRSKRITNKFIEGDYTKTNIKYIYEILSIERNVESGMKLDIFLEQLLELTRMVFMNMLEKEENNMNHDLVITMNNYMSMLLNQGIVGQKGGSFNDITSDVRVFSQYYTETDITPNIFCNKIFIRNVLKLQLLLLEINSDFIGILKEIIPNIEYFYNTQDIINLYKRFYGIYNYDYIEILNNKRKEVIENILKNYSGYASGIFTQFPKKTEFNSYGNTIQNNIPIMAGGGFNDKYIPNITIQQNSPLIEMGKTFDLIIMLIEFLINLNIEGIISPNEIVEYIKNILLYHIPNGGHDTQHTFFSPGSAYPETEAVSLKRKRETEKSPDERDLWDSSEEDIRPRVVQRRGGGPDSMDEKYFIDLLNNYLENIKKTIQIMNSDEGQHGIVPIEDEEYSINVSIEYIINNIQNIYGFFYMLGNYMNIEDNTELRDVIINELRDLLDNILFNDPQYSIFKEYMISNFGDVNLYTYILRKNTIKNIIIEIFENILKKYIILLNQFGKHSSYLNRIIDDNPMVYILTSETFEILKMELNYIKGELFENLNLETYMSGGGLNSKKIITIDNKIKKYNQNKKSERKKYKTRRIKIYSNLKKDKVVKIKKTRRNRK